MLKPVHAVVVDQLCKSYGTILAADDVSFTVNQGEMFAFLGPNGAGKSTTVEVIETVRPPTSGKISVLGMDVVKHKSEIVRRIGVLPQDFSSFDRITVRETLWYYAQLFGCSTNIDALMDLTNLRGKADAQFKTLSGGLKQRLGIAAALVNDPEVVFLDEPTTGLDPRARREAWDVLKGLRNRGKTVFITTHYMEEAELLADTVAIISKGRIVAVDTPARLTRAYADDIRLTLKSIDATALDVVQKMGFRPRHTDGADFSVSVKNAQDVRCILTAIERAGLSLHDIDVRRPNLEEVFLKLTGDSLEGRPNGGSR